MQFIGLLIAVVLTVGTTMQVLVLKGAVTPVVAPEAAQEPQTVSLEPNMNREAIVSRVASALEFDETLAGKLHETYRAMQWDAVNEIVVPHIAIVHNLSSEETEALYTNATVYLSEPDDILKSLYVPGVYVFHPDDSVVEIVTALINPVLDAGASYITERLDEEQVALLALKVAEEVQRAGELLPDLVPLPPQDVALRYDGDRTLLIFTTIYYNQGRGNLELRADPSTIGVIGDFDRDVFQRVYRTDGTYHERPAGTFHWHQEHLHYHFRDFVEYRLVSETGTDETPAHDLAQKSTFCIRDVSRVYALNLEPNESADYRICGRERQGVSVGWGDAYFNTYADQNLDISELPSGTYTLSFFVNPEDRFDELTKENNYADATFEYDREVGTIELIGHFPEELPEFEHIHIEQDL